ncbi:MAG: TCP-1/cpn60 chaperonin family protein [Candidatus Nitrosotenuis sp.]|nr:TCP-1/cpn60 chaperonin family protein [Candidatus Nitrosotenuis sp.]
MTTPQIVLLKEGTTQTKGNDAQKNNISAAKLIAELVRTSLGPRGMDKMLVDTMGDVTITNDGATILKEIDIQHPAAKMMVEVSKATDVEVGDGTTSTVVLAGALLEKAEELIGKNVHPTVVVDGFKKASEKAIAELRQIGIKIDALDKKLLKKVAVTTLSSKMVSSNAEELADIIVDAVLSIAEKVGDKYRADIDNIKVEKKGSSSIRNTELVHGIVLDKEVVHGGMPKRVENAKIALLNAPLEIEKTEFDAKININSPEQMQVYLDEENKMLKKMVDKIAASGANVVLCQKGIDDMAQYYLAKANILAVRRIKESDLTKLSKATGARIVTNINELTDRDLGSAKTVEEKQVESDKWVFIQGCKNPKAVSILARGGSQRVVDEVERSIHDALMAVKDVVEYPHILVGGGAPEARVAARLREWANTLEGRPQLAAQKFAEGLETIPLVLAENAGMDPLDTQVRLRTKGASGSATVGIDVMNSRVDDLQAQNIYEPLAVKEQVINAATEAACMILRIDDVIAASKSPSHAPSSPGGPGMMGGMGGMDM